MRIVVLCVRPAETADMPAMIELLGQLFALEVDFAFDREKQALGLGLLLASPSGHVWVSDEDGEVLGMLTVQTLISTAEGGVVGLIEDVVVAATARGRGIGRALLETAEHWARERRMPRLQLLADRGNGSALAFYARRGWRETTLVALRRVLAT